jgi:hypothetical protein
MLKFLIILAAWITPGVLLFLYLLWLSKRKGDPRGGLQAPASLSAATPVAENDRSAPELVRPIAPAATPKKARG